MRQDPSEGRLGYSRPSHARLMIRSHAFVVAVAEEMGEWWVRMVAENERGRTRSGSSSESWRRVERQHMEDAALDIVEMVEKMPRPMRDVVVLRASGASWREIGQALPDRAHFSMADDWCSALRLLWSRGSSSVARLV